MMTRNKNITFSLNPHPHVPLTLFGFLVFLEETLIYFKGSFVVCIDACQSSPIEFQVIFRGSTETGDEPSVTLFPLNFSSTSHTPTHQWVS